MQSHSSDLFGNEPGRTCTICKRFLPFDAFHRNRQNQRNGRFPYCKECRSKDAKKRNATDKARQTNKAAVLWSRYKITVVDFEAMLTKQQGLCAICGNAETALDPRTGRVKLLAVDHSHTTGVTRELLCTRCNNGLGNFKEDPSILQAAISYLQKHEGLRSSSPGSSSA